MSEFRVFDLRKKKKSEHVGKNFLGKIFTKSASRPFNWLSNEFQHIMIWTRIHLELWLFLYAHFGLSYQKSDFNKIFSKK